MPLSEVRVFDAFYMHVLARALRHAILRGATHLQRIQPGRHLQIRQRQTVGAWAVHGILPRS